MPPAAAGGPGGATICLARLVASALKKVVDSTVPDFVSILEFRFKPKCLNMCMMSEDSTASFDLLWPDRDMAAYQLNSDTEFKLGLNSVDVLQVLKSCDMSVDYIEVCVSDEKYASMRIIRKGQELSSYKLPMTQTKTNDIDAALWGILESNETMSEVPHVTFGADRFAKIMHYFEKVNKEKIMWAVDKHSLQLTASSDKDSTKVTWKLSHEQEKTGMANEQARTKMDASGMGDTTMTATFKIAELKRAALAAKALVSNRVEIFFKEDQTLMMRYKFDADFCNPEQNSAVDSDAFKNAKQYCKEDKAEELKEIVTDLSIAQMDKIMGSGQLGELTRKVLEDRKTTLVEALDDKNKEPHGSLRYFIVPTLENAEYRKLKRQKVEE